MNTFDAGQADGQEGYTWEQGKAASRTATPPKSAQRDTWLDIRVIARAALAQADILVPQWLPKGKREGPEWVALNPTRVDEHLGSFKVNLESGQWADFATGERGGDLVSLYAYLNRVSQIQAARELAQRLGIANSPPKQAKKPEWKPIVPVPDDAPPPSKTHPIHGKPSHVWTYRDAKGATLCQSCRFDFVNEQGDPDKTFSPLTYYECTKAGKEGKRYVEIGEREWRWKGLTGPKPLYNFSKFTG